MKRLLLMRHGKACSKSYGVSDHDRALTNNGALITKIMSDKIIKYDTSFDLMLSSSASRALSTCKIFASTLGYDEKNIKVVPSIYNCTSSHLEHIIRKIDISIDSVAIFGHNPTFHYMCDYLSNQTTKRFSESSMICVDFNSKNWQKCFESKITIKFLNYPDND